MPHHLDFSMPAHCGAITKSTINFAEYEFNAPTEDALNLQ